MGLPTVQGKPIAAQPSPGKATSIRASAKLTDAWVETTVIDVRDARICALWFKYDGATASTGGYPQIRVLISADDLATSDKALGGTEAPPTVGTDVWYAPQILDATPTDAVLVGAGPTGASYTIAPEWREVTMGGMVLKTFPLDAITNAIRSVVPVRVDYARWLYVSAVEKGSATTPGKLAISYNASF